MGLNTNSSAYTTYIQYEELETVKLKDLLDTYEYFLHKGRICHKFSSLPKEDKNGKYKAYHIITDQAISEGSPKDIPVYFGRSVSVTKIKITLFMCHRDTATQNTIRAWRPGFTKLVPHEFGEKLDWSPPAMEYSEE